VENRIEGGVIVVKLREAMEQYRRRHGVRVTYALLAARTGVSESTLQAIAARPGYNTTLDTVDRIAAALDCSIESLLERVDQ
jgi:DNA-binding Xre family transcriptional regulator